MHFGNIDLHSKITIFTINDVLMLST